MHTVSVIIPTRNRAKMVCEAIESVLVPERPGIQFEVIIVDDGSTDNTREAVQQYPIVYLEGTGRRASVARNTGLARATGEFVAFLDDDDVWTEEYPLPQVRYLAENPEIQAIISQIAVANHDLTQVSIPQPEWLPSGWIFKPLLSYVPVVGSLVVRRAMAEEIGGFDTSLLGVEDWEWALRIARQGQIAFLPEVAIKYRVHGQAGDHTAKRLDVEWGRFNERAEVFARHTSHLSMLERIQLRPIFWKHRGFYSALFINMALNNSDKRDLRLRLKGVNYALRASLIHTALWFARRTLPIE